MLAEMDSIHVAEWQAFEMENGPLGREWDAEVLAQLVESVQQLNHMFGAANFTDKKHPKNPVPKPELYPRPHDWYLYKTDRPKWEAELAKAKAEAKRELEEQQRAADEKRRRAIAGEDVD